MIRPAGSRFMISSYHWHTPYLRPNEQRLLLRLLRSRRAVSHGDMPADVLCGWDFRLFTLDFRLLVENFRADHLLRNSAIALASVRRPFSASAGGAWAACSAALAACSAASAALPRQRPSIHAGGGVPPRLPVPPLYPSLRLEQQWHPHSPASGRPFP